MIDLRDILTFGGVVILSAGVYFVQPHYSLISLGACLFYIGIKVK